MTPKHDDRPSGSGSADRSDASLAGLVDIGAPPPPAHDVHTASTAVAKLPSALLDALKSGVLRTPRPTSPVDLSPLLRQQQAEPAEEADMIDIAHGGDEPETRRLVTMVIEDGVVMLAPPAALEVEEARTIELHLDANEPRVSALASLEGEIARLPRRWRIAGALVAALVAASVTAILVWTLLQPL